MSKKLRAHNRQLRREVARTRKTFGTLVAQRYYAEEVALNQQAIADTLKAARSGIFRKVWAWLFGRGALNA